MITEFKQFMRDTEAGEMYITGVAGTGKTTSLRELIQYCIDNKISCATAAYTHKAVSVLASKLPKPREGFDLRTLHSYLKKCPTINDKAVKLTHVDGNAQIGLPNHVKVLFIDEFSMVGEQDYLSLQELMYDEDTGDLKTKVVYIGDPNQLPPVKDMIAVNPKGPYWVKLTQIHRQKGDNKLIDTLLKLNDYINGEPAEPLQEHSNLIRGQDIVDLYMKCKTSKILLAYTNERVEALNALVQGRANPELGDGIFSPTTRVLYTLEDIMPTSDAIVTIRGELLELDSKFKTLETLHEIKGVSFMNLMDANGNIMPRAIVFGHSTYLMLSQDLAREAVNANKRIEAKFNEDPKLWAQKNWSHELARNRAQAWKRYLAFKACVICTDFAHAMTVHKSQGSTYENVFLDTEDMGKCATSDYITYLKLLYVAISRASNKVYTN